MDAAQDDAGDMCCLLPGLGPLWHCPQSCSTRLHGLPRVPCCDKSLSGQCLAPTNPDAYTNLNTCSVAKKFLDDVELGSDSIRNAVVEFMPYSFAAVNAQSKRFLEVGSPAQWSACRQRALLKGFSSESRSADSAERTLCCSGSY